VLAVDADAVDVEDEDADADADDDDDDDDDDDAEDDRCAPAAAAVPEDAKAQREEKNAFFLCEISLFFALFWHQSNYVSRAAS
jgi:hypothetical protein